MNAAAGARPSDVARKSDTKQATVRPAAHGQLCTCAVEEGPRQPARCGNVVQATRAKAAGSVLVFSEAKQLRVLFAHAEHHPAHSLCMRALRSDLIDPTITVHNGRVVKRTGDGVLVEFRSVVDAVRYAIEVQNAMVERNAGLPPQRRIDFRIGVHLGDIVEERDGDLMGDGVNIAARLEGMAKPGAICLSEDAYRQVKARLNLAVSDLGPTQLKNIAEPIRVYSLEVDAASLLVTQRDGATGEVFGEACAAPQAFHRGPSVQQHERRSVARVLC